MIPFVKTHGLGNDYLVLNEKDLNFPLTPPAIRRLCHRNWGVGSDGILLRVDPTRGDFGLRIFNPDGSEAEKSGNGLRIFAKYLYDHGHTKRRMFVVETKGGLAECVCRITGERVTSVIVEMGRVTFRAREIPMSGPDREVVAVPLPVLIDGQSLTITAVSVGNPHCVVFTDKLEEFEVRRVGPLIERHPVFPKRVNVQFAKVEGRDRVAILIWERGVGSTLASGSSACAVAAAAVKNRFCDHGWITVRMPGGELMIEVRPDWSLRLQGPVEEVCSGTLSPDLVTAIKAGTTIP